MGNQYVHCSSLDPEGRSSRDSGIFQIKGKEASHFIPASIKPILRIFFLKEKSKKKRESSQIFFPGFLMEFFGDYQIK